MSVITYEHIEMSYHDKKVIKDFNLSIEKGEFVCIIGSSGCGKTTILKMVNGLVKATKGNVYINDENILDKDLIRLRRNIGYAIQGSVLFPHMNVEQNIAYVPNLLNKQNKEKTKQAVKKWMHLTGLEESLKHRYPHELSGGQQQRVGIARALAASPEILLMDEPFGAVDEITRSTLQDEIKKIHQENQMTILFVTHDIREAMKLGTKILVMEAGKIMQYDTADHIMNKPANEYVAKLVRQSL
ncbi:MAG: ABC transporter ATP-binding protein [Erysipelotrichia bacterium]|nr:ABC transporter ATP-binding protein [Erysipelotrichia bacterium]NCC53974.1 ABC transporter ATP-binding protein [Erysipelotrichia bacterium]